MMNRSRRQILKTGCGLVAAAALGRSAEPVVGLIYPQKSPVPAEALAMYPSGVKFLMGDVGLKTMTPEGYDSVIDRIVPAAKELAKGGAQAIVLMGTSLSFYKGAAFNQSLTDSIHNATGLPATTMSTGVVEGLRAVGGRRLAVATAYNEEVTERLRIFLKESGFEVLAIKGLGLVRIGDPGKVSQQELEKFTVDVFQMAPKADAMLVSCGGFRTLELIAPLEKQCKVPVVSSLPHALWAGVRLVGLNGNAPGYGTLLSKA
jgi:arylmalonate decarboxylase